MAGRSWALSDARLETHLSPVDSAPVVSRKFWLKGTQSSQDSMSACVDTAGVWWWVLVCTGVVGLGIQPSFLGREAGLGQRAFFVGLKI